MPPIGRRGTVLLDENLLAKLLWKNSARLLSEPTNVVITRFRRDSGIYEISPQPEKRRRGRPKVNGNKIDLASILQKIICLLKKQFFLRNSSKAS